MKNTMSRRSPSHNTYEGAFTTEEEVTDATTAATAAAPPETEEGPFSVEREDSFGGAEKLTLMPLAILTFYSVSGGPFGCEEAIRSGGYFYTLVGFLVFPFIYSVQEAMMTAELGSAYPEAAGGVAWVEEAFGPFAGWMCGYLGWVSGATDVS
jgi:hypothetical protein